MNCIGSSAYLININKLTIYCISFWELEMDYVGYVEVNTLLGNMGSLNQEANKYINQEMPSCISNLVKNITVQMYSSEAVDSQTVELYSFVLGSVFQYTL